jgi:probable selenium-dependent hydroxylase accessory protein YqeC
VGIAVTLSACFEKKLFHPGEDAAGPVVVTVIGSGGKTSLIHLIAAKTALQGKKVLITTTTKIFPVEGAVTEGKLPGNAGLLYRLKTGVMVAGRFNEELGKLEPPGEEGLAEILEVYDLVLIEGDGSRMLPLKGWAEHEPVVPANTVCTVGVLPLWPLGNPVSEKIVHRMSLFSALTGAAEGDILTPEHLLRVICGGGKSLFSAAMGRKILFLSHIEDEAGIEKAGELVALLPAEFRAGLYGIIAGSTKRKTAVLL